MSMNKYIVSLLLYQGGNDMPAKRQYKGATQKLRARWHDLNSQRRHRGKSTVTWEQYKKLTSGGRKKLSRGK